MFVYKGRVDTGVQELCSLPLESLTVLASSRMLVELMLIFATCNPTRLPSLYQWPMDVVQDHSL